MAVPASVDTNRMALPAAPTSKANSMGHPQEELSTNNTNKHEKRHEQKKAPDNKNRRRRGGRAARWPGAFVFRPLCLLLFVSFFVSFRVISWITAFTRPRGGRSAR